MLATMMGMKKMPPPITLDTTMAAASSGPSRRSREVGGVSLTREKPASSPDESTRDAELADAHELSRTVFGGQMHFGVHEL